MPSSTSSSDRREAFYRVPTGLWARTWVLALVAAAAVLGAMEATYRARGLRPSVVDDKLLWALHRRRVYGEGGKTPLVVVGASRAQLGFWPQTFERLFPRYRVVQLAVRGAYPIATLRDLAQDKAFRGIVLCVVTAPGFLRMYHSDQQPYVDYYHNLFEKQWPGDELINRRISTFFQERFVVVNPMVRLDRVASSLLRTGALPEPNYAVMLADRSWLADYSKVRDLIERRERRVRRDWGAFRRRGRFDPEEWLVEAMEVEPMVRRIEARGGRVVFVRYITTGTHYRLSERDLPKAAFWDRFAERTSAETIHFRDVASLRGYDCPDLSHLNHDDARRYTAALAEELHRRGIIQR